MTWQFICVYRMAQNFDRGNIDEENIDQFDEFLSIRQHFPHQNFPLIIFCCLPARPLSYRALSLVYAPMQNFSCPNIYKWKNSGLELRETTVCIPNRSAKLRHNIYS